MSIRRHHADCYDAVTRDDPQFDGQFVSAVLTTGIFCRPVCRAQTPRPENVRFFATAAAAAEAGFRPCLRCRPESAPELPDESIASPVVLRALRLIGEGFLDERDVRELAQRLNLSQRHLRRLFLDELGAPPVAVAQTRRLLFAKKLIDETNLPMTEIAFSAGYASVRRFNEAIRQTYARTPNDLRARRRRAAVNPDQTVLEITLYYRDPYYWPGVLAFLHSQAISGVESVDDRGYRRTILVDGMPGILEVLPHPETRSALIRVPSRFSRHLLSITERVKQLFDFRVDPVAIDAYLSQDPDLAPLIRRQPGMRVPGVWDWYEAAIRTLVEADQCERDRQLVSALAAAIGERWRDSGDPCLTHIFPTPDRLLHAPLAKLGISGPLADALRTVASSAIDEAPVLSRFAGPHALEQLTSLPHIGEEIIQRLDIHARLACNGTMSALAAVPNPLQRYAHPILQPRWDVYAAMYRALPQLDTGLAMTSTVGRKAPALRA